MDITPQAWPEWYDGRHINEVLFCQQFLDKHPMKCVRGRLFTVDSLAYYLNAVLTGELQPKEYN